MALLEPECFGSALNVYADKHGGLFSLVAKGATEPWSAWFPDATARVRAESTAFASKDNEAEPVQAEAKASAAKDDEAERVRAETSAKKGEEKPASKHEQKCLIRKDPDEIPLCTTPSAAPGVRCKA